jgi:hypothetical protein
MKNNEPVPNNIEGEKKIKEMRRIEDARLQRRKERNPRIIVRVPKRKFKRPHHADP